MHYDREGVGSSDDAESAAGDGTLIAIAKRQRTLLGTIAVLLGAGLPAALIGGRLDVSVGAFNAALPAGSAHIGRVAVDSLLDSLVSMVGGRLDSVRRIDTLRYVARLGGQDSVRRVDTLRFTVAVGRQDSVRRVDTLRYLADGRLDSVSNILGGKLDSIRNRVPVKLDTSVFSPSVSSGNVSIGTSSNKANVLKTGSITTTAATADQVVLTYTVTNGKTFYLEYVQCEARLTTLSATASILGTISLETPSGTKVATYSLVNGTGELDDQCPTMYLSEPIPIAAAVVVRCVTTPTAVTSMLWVCNFGGYEK